MKRWVSRGLLWAVALYIVTIIIIPIVCGEKLSTFKITFGIPLWIITGLAMGSLFYNKGNKSRKRNRR